ncbi:MAG TPA: GC-type dockerin domain-anchored protein, partial [Phycisphaerales bacterium]|nr:GC-type dockerin domain-anchored protein [Phycisphaerales bacterium]
AGSWVDLHPAGAVRSSALSVYAKRQVGQAGFDGEPGTWAGLWWNGTAESWDPLPLPPGSWAFTSATSIWSDDTTIRIGGYGFNRDTGRSEALLWEATPSTLCEGELAWDNGIGQPGMDGDSVRAFLGFDGGSGEALYVGGRFATAGGVTVNGIARWHSDSQTWSPLGGGVGGGSPAVNDLAIFNDGAGNALYAGGLFTSAGGVTVNGIAKWNSDTQTWSPLGAGAPATIELAVYNDGTGEGLYSGGQGSSRYIGRWDGSEWSTLGEGTNGPVRALAVFEDGDGEALFVGGAFTMAGDVPASKIARWDGNEWSALGAGVTTDVFALAVYNDGNGKALYVGGAFTMAGDVQASNIARWDGNEWSALGEGTNFSVWALTVFDDGAGPALYASGEFTEAGGAPASKIARWDGNEWSPLGSGMNSTVGALYAFNDGNGPGLYAGGGFTQAGGLAANRIAVWRCSNCRIDLNSDGDVNTLDFLIFLNWWVAKDPRADWNGDAEIDTLDLLAFINDWVAGCP